MEETKTLDISEELLAEVTFPPRLKRTQNTEFLLNAETQSEIL